MASATQEYLRLRRKKTHAPSPSQCRPRRTVGGTGIAFHPQIGLVSTSVQMTKVALASRPDPCSLACCSCPLLASAPWTCLAIARDFRGQMTPGGRSTKMQHPGMSILQACGGLSVMSMSVLSNVLTEWFGTSVVSSLSHIRHGASNALLSSVPSPRGASTDQ